MIVTPLLYTIGVYYLVGVGVAIYVTYNTPIKSKEDIEMGYLKFS